MMNVNAIPKTYLRETCKFGAGVACCAFLMLTGDGFVCSKGTPIEAIIRERLEAGTIGARGDNCDGRPE